jgi:hypothetical protein
MIDNALAVLPLDHTALLSAFYVELNEKRTTPIKLQKVLMQGTHANVNLNHLSAHSATSSVLDITKSDIVEAHSLSQASRIFTAPLSFPRNRMSPQRFTTWVRAFLRIPQQPHLGNLADRSGHAYQTERCLAEHTKHDPEAASLDLHGNHANSNCPSVAAGRHRRHTLLKSYIYILAIEAGCHTSVEPPTSQLLHGAFTPEQCRKLFPKAPTVGFTAFSKRVVEDTATWAEMDDCPERDELRLDLRERLEGIKVETNEKAGLRIDLLIRDIETLEELWIDATCIHSTCKSRLPKELAHTVKNLNWEPTSADDRRPPGRAASDQTQHKHNKYAPLIAIAAKQHMDGMRQSTPTFLAAVTTTHGEMGLDTFVLQEWLTKAYKRKLLREPDRIDGLTHAQLTATFRNKLRLAVQIATAKGQADMILSAGLPRGSCKKHSYAQWGLSPHL